MLHITIITIISIIKYNDCYNFVTHVIFMGTTSCDTGKFPKE